MVSWRPCSVCRTVCTVRYQADAIFKSVPSDEDFQRRQEGSARRKSAAVGLQPDGELIPTSIGRHSIRKIAFDLHLAKTALAECRELHFVAISLASRRFVQLLHSQTQTGQNKSG